MRRRSIVRILTLLVALTVVSTSGAEAARLVEVSREDVRLVGGEPTESAPPGVRSEGWIESKATGFGNLFQSHTFIVQPDADAPEPERDTSSFDRQSLFEILPDEGEQARDCVIVDYSFEAESSLTATGAADARMGVGGFGVTATAEPLAITFNGPSQITLNPGPGESVIFAFGPSTQAPGEPDITGEAMDSFLARIGDEVQVNLATAVAWDVPPGDSVDGSVLAQIGAAVRPGLVACPADLLEVPALGAWGLGALALLLGAGGAFLLGRGLG